AAVLPHVHAAERARRRRLFALGRRVSLQERIARGAGTAARVARRGEHPGGEDDKNGVRSHAGNVSRRARFRTWVAARRTWAHFQRFLMDSSEASATALMKAAGTGDPRAVDQMFPLVYDELRRLASVVRVGRAGETIGATVLVHEAYLKLVRSEDLSWTDRAHFLAIAARAMRQVLVDMATRKATEKHGGDQLDVSLS